MIEIRAKGIRFGFDARTGLLDGFTVEDEGHEIALLHRAPWVGTEEIMPPGTPPHLMVLGGDFFCAPFAAAKRDHPFMAGPPIHSGTSPNRRPGGCGPGCNAPSAARPSPRNSRLKTGTPGSISAMSSPAGAAALPSRTMPTCRCLGADSSVAPPNRHGRRRQRRPKSIPPVGVPACATPRGQRRPTAFLGSTDRWI
ncbi:UNVERIFIED_ORG: hypothetical protein GGE44_003484 [Rhizobium esperanzae]